MTGDLDISVSVSPDNAERLSRVLHEWGGFPAAEVPPTLFDELGKMVSFGVVPVVVDILTRPAGVDFEPCFERRRIVDWDGVEVPLISLTDLRTNKSASGRPKDQADLVYLPPGE